MDGVEQEIKRLKVALAELEARVKGDEPTPLVVEARTDRRQLLAKAAGGAALLSIPAAGIAGSYFINTASVTVGEIMDLFINVIKAGGCLQFMI